MYLQLTPPETLGNTGRSTCSSACYLGRNMYRGQEHALAALQQLRGNHHGRSVEEGKCALTFA